MRAIVEHIQERSTRYAALPFYAFLRDESVDAEQRFAFVPGLAHFVMSFADLYAFVLREEPAQDRFQEIVNEHTYEDGDHWKWYLADLATLGEDKVARFGEALRFIWSPHTAKIRQLSYRIARLGLGATSVQKLVLVECIEAVGKISLEGSGPVGAELSRRRGRNLVYFGPHHLESEQNHTVENESVRRWLLGVELSEGSRAGLSELVDQTFDAFTDFASELLCFAEERPALG